jgi:ATP-dependent exoDNAse (exonuclease V) beta subunit
MSVHPNRFPPLVIRASAGAGKTYQLSTRYLELAATGRTPDTILATTFTRKAAGEILARILQRLAEAADSPVSLAQVADAIHEPAFDRKRCLDLLESMVRQLHRLRVCTLDSFFIQVARSFGLELSLPPGWQIVDEIDDQLLRAEAVRRMLGEESTGDVVQLMNLLTKGEAVASVALQISGLVTGLYSIYQETSADAWNQLKPRKPLDEREVRNAVATLSGLALPADKRIEKARAATVDALSREDWTAFLAKGFVSKVAAGEDSFYSKPIPPDVVEVCETLIEHAKAILLNRLAHQTSATYRLLERFDRAYSQLKLARRAMRFDDIARHVSGDWVGQRLNEVFFRLDAHLSHLLLDEFQDTSGMQWKVLRPFAQSVVADRRTRSFFCVGDVKQAIYGWRGGVAEIFDAIGQELPGLESMPLDESRRSSPVVIETVNRVFGSIAQNAAMADHQEAASHWASRFAAHSTFHKDRPGYCRLVVAGDDKACDSPDGGDNACDSPDGGVASPGSAVASQSPDRKASARYSKRAVGETTLAFAADEIVRLHEESPGFSIGVLVRRNISVAKLIYLLRDRGVDASEEGGNPLDDSPAVELVLSLLTLADHPGDTVVRYHLAKSPLAESLALTSHSDSDAAWRLSTTLRRRLIDEGYGPTIYSVVEHLAPHCDERDLGRLMQLVELAYAYQADATMRADDFVALVRHKRIESPRAADVRVMTIHQSKGLEFDIVVLPELDAALRGQPPQVVVNRPNPTDSIDGVLRYASQEVQQLLPERFQRMFAEQKRRVVEESLCVLYVALTRAAHALHMIVAPSSESEKKLPGTFAGILRGALTNGNPLAAATVAYECGDPKWHEAMGRAPSLPAAPPSVAGESAAASIRLRPSPERPLRNLDRRSPSSLEGGAKVQLSFALRLDSAESLCRGTAIHAWFELIEWLDDGLPSAEALRSAAKRLGTPAHRLEEWLAMFRSAVAKPAVAAALSRKGRVSGDALAARFGKMAARLHNPQWVVYREKSFAVRDGATILSGSIDRLVVLCEASQPVAAEIFDFKTDTVSPGDRAAMADRTAFYRPQLEAYRRAVTQMYGLESSMVAASLVFLNAGEIAPVE